MGKRRHAAGTATPSADEATSAVVREALARTAFFGGLAGEVLDQLALDARLTDTYRGEMLLEEGHRSRDVIVLLDGRADVRIESITPNLEVTVARLGAGEVVGETLLLGEDVAHATIVVMTAGRALRVPVASLRAVCSANAEAAAILYARSGMVLRERLRRVNERLVTHKRKLEF